MPDGLDQKTFGGIAGYDGRAGITALFDRAAPVQLQAALRFFPRVAFVAFRDEDRADFPLEEFRLFRRRRGGSARGDAAA